MKDSELVVATYNVRRFVGRDGKRDPARITAVVRELKADVVALQEVVFPAGPERQGRDGELRLLPDLEDFDVVMGHVRWRKGLRFGNALLTRRRVLDHRCLDLTVPPMEERGMIDARLDSPGRRLRVVATHLGLGLRERRSQIERLLAHLSEDPGSVLPGTVLTVLGDFNEWRRRPRPIAKLEAALGATARLRSYPTPRPLFALDRIWVRPVERLEELRVHRSPRASRASDHFPVVARIRA